MSTSKSRALKGYKGRDRISHRTYSRKTSINRFKKTGKFTYRGTRVGNKVIYGLGHAAGERWGAEKEIDPNSQVRKYSKNSPSFDEGVYKYKESAKSKALKQ
jgi:hypothetical protein